MAEDKNGECGECFVSHEVWLQDAANNGSKADEIRDSAFANINMDELRRAESEDFHAYLNQLRRIAAEAAKKATPVPVMTSRESSVEGSKE